MDSYFFDSQALQILDFIQNLDFQKLTIDGDQLHCRISEQKQLCLVY